MTSQQAKQAFNIHQESLRCGTPMAATPSASPASWHAVSSRPGSAVSPSNIPTGTPTRRTLHPAGRPAAETRPRDVLALQDLADRLLEKTIVLFTGEFG